MNDNFKKVIRGAQKLKLSQQEKAEMKAELLRHIEMNPAEGVIWYETPKFFSLTFLGRPVHRALVPALICVIVIGVGGATFASKRALPGDVLYSVKILNENVEQGLTFDPIKAAKLEEVHAITRLAEAETLSVQGKLDEKKKTELTDSFNKSSEKAIEHLGTVYEKNKEQSKKSFGSFKNNVKSRKKALQNLSGREDDDFVKQLSSSTQSIAEKIDAPDEEKDQSDKNSQRFQDRKGRRQD